MALSDTITDDLVEAHRAMLAFVERRVGDRATAEDILQEAWVKGIERGEQIEDASSAKAWMYRVLRNAIIDRYRRTGASERALAALERELDVVHASEGEAMVCQCIGRLAQTLPPDQAHALRRIEIDGVPVKTFAEEEGLTASNAGVRVFRARKALKARVESACGTCAEHGCTDCSCGPPP